MRLWGAAVVRPAHRRDRRPQPALLAFARYYSVTIHTCEPAVRPARAAVRRRSRSPRPTWFPGPPTCLTSTTRSRSWKPPAGRSVPTSAPSPPGRPPAPDDMLAQGCPIASGAGGIRINVPPATYFSVLPDEVPTSRARARRNLRQDLTRRLWCPAQLVAIERGTDEGGHSAVEQPGRNDDDNSRRTTSVTARYRARINHHETRLSD